MAAVARRRTFHVQPALDAADLDAVVTTGVNATVANITGADAAAVAASVDTELAKIVAALAIVKTALDKLVGNDDNAVGMVSDALVAAKILE